MIGEGGPYRSRSRHRNGKLRGAISFSCSDAVGLRFVGQLFENIRSLIAEGRYVVGEHAAERLDERGILEWQVVDGMDDGDLLLERPNASPNPAVEVEVTLADGTQVKAIWSLLASADLAKLVTVHFFD
jgi:hypothetical protein